MSTPSPMGTPLPWNLVAPAYAAEVVPMFVPYARDALRLAAVPPASRVLDVACGPGTLALLAAAAGHTVDAIDFSPAMIERLAARLETSGVGGVTAQLADGQALPFAEATFQTAFSMFGLMFFPDRAKGFAELRRVLVPGGRAVVASWQQLENVPVMKAMFGALHEAMSRVLGPDAPGPRELPLTTEEACRTEMSASFRQVEVHTVVHCELHPSAEAMWDSLERTMAPLVLMRKNLGEERWAPLADAARSAILAEVGGGSVEMSMPAWFTVGVAA